MEMCSFFGPPCRSIIALIQQTTDEYIPIIQHNSQKPYWYPELQELKQASIDAYNLWKLCDKPRSGIVNRLRLENKYKYKLAIRELSYRKDQEFDDDLSDLYLRKSMDKLWVKWNSKFSKKSLSADYVDGCHEDEEIANTFSKHFSSYQLNSSYFNSTQFDDCFKCVQSLMMSELLNIPAQSYPSLFDVSDVEKALSCLKFGKAGGFDGFTKESIAYCHPVILIQLEILYNLICIHGSVPDDFGIGIVVPVVKDRLGNLCVSDNYRPVTLSPFVSDF